MSEARRFSRVRESKISTRTQKCILHCTVTRSVMQPSCISHKRCIRRKIRDTTNNRVDAIPSKASGRMSDRGAALPSMDIQCSQGKADAVPVASASEMKLDAAKTQAPRQDPGVERENGPCHFRTPTAGRRPLIHSPLSWLSMPASSLLAGRGNDSFSTRDAARVRSAAFNEQGDLTAHD